MGGNGILLESFFRNPAFEKFEIFPVVRRNHDGRSRFVEGKQRFEYGFFVFGVQERYRLVQDQEGFSPYQRTDKADALVFSRAQFGNFFLQDGTDPEKFGKFFETLRGCLTAPGRFSQKQGLEQAIFPDIVLLQQVKIMKIKGNAVQTTVGPFHASKEFRMVTRYQFQERRFSGPADAVDENEISRTDGHRLEIEVVDSDGFGNGEYRHGIIFVKPWPILLPRERPFLPGSSLSVPGYTRIFFRRGWI